MWQSKLKQENLQVAQYYEQQYEKVKQGDESLLYLLQANEWLRQTVGGTLWPSLTRG